MFKRIKTFILMNVGIVLISSEVYFFNIQNGFTMGGVSGLSILLEKLIQNRFITTGILVSFLNILLLIVGFIFLGKNNGIKTVYCSALFSLLLLVFERTIPLDTPITKEPLLELIYSIIVGGIGTGILFYTNATSGGTDITALIIKKYTGMDAGKALLIADLLIVISSFFIFGITIGMFSLLGLLIKTFVVDGVIGSLLTCKSFMIITEKPEQIIDYIINELNHSATTLNAEGVFSKKRKKVLITLCRKKEAVRLKKKIYGIDSNAFVIVTSTAEIIGRGFGNIVY